MRRVPVYLADRDTVRTGSDGKATILMPDHSRMELGPQSSFTLESTRAGNYSSLLSVGALRAVVSRVADREFNVKTPLAIVAVRGTEFEVNVRASGVTSVHLSEGLLAVADQHGHEVLLHPNESVRVDLEGLHAAAPRSRSYRTAASSFHDRMRLAVAPAAKLDEDWSLLPVLNAAYAGTKQILDVAGAGTLFQQQMDYRGGLTGIYAVPDSRWRLKSSASYKYELLKETKDETWGSGLFDYRKWDVGVGADYVFNDPFAVRLGLDYYELAFPNYSSLESQAALDFNGQALARELVGDHVLDTQNVMASAEVDFPVRDSLIVDGGATAVYERFPEQHVVDSAGQLTSPLRHDLIALLQAGVRVPDEVSSTLRLLDSLDLSLAYDGSNQSSYDAARTKYIPSYYDYWELGVGPSARVSYGPKDTATSVDFSAHWDYRRYPSRPAQDGTGVYLGDATHTTLWTVGAVLTHPLAEHFNLLFDFQYGEAGANTQFEQFYTYHYSAANYLFGFKYDF